MIRFTITGQTPAQKNGKQIAFNPRTNRPFITSNKIVKAWQASAQSELAYRIKQQTEKVSIAYTFFVKDNRPRDIDNMIASVNDVLQAVGILQNDSWQWLAIMGADATLDKENPRAEITIYPYSETSLI